MGWGMSENDIAALLRAAPLSITIVAGLLSASYRDAIRTALTLNLLFQAVIAIAGLVQIEFPRLIGALVGTVIWAAAAHSLRRGVARLARYARRSWNSNVSPNPVLLPTDNNDLTSSVVPAVPVQTKISNNGWLLIWLLILPALVFASVIVSLAWKPNGAPPGVEEATERNVGRFNTSVSGQISGIYCNGPKWLGWCDRKPIIKISTFSSESGDIKSTRSKTAVAYYAPDDVFFLADKKDSKEGVCRVKKLVNGDNKIYYLTVKTGGNPTNESDYVDSGEPLEISFRCSVEKLADDQPAELSARPWWHGFGSLPTDAKDRELDAVLKAQDSTATGGGAGALGSQDDIISQTPIPKSIDDASAELDALLKEPAPITDNDSMFPAPHQGRAVRQ